MCAIQAPLVDGFNDYFGTDHNRRRAFQILGFDVMFDGAARPYLLEVNSHPSFQLTSVVEGEDCKCMDAPHPHSHEICLVDEVAKVMAVRRGIQISARKAGEEAGGEEDDAYFQVDCEEEENDLWLQVHRLWRVVRGKKLSSTRFRTFATRAGICEGRLASHEADLLYQRFKALREERGDLSSEGESEAAMEFGLLLLEVAGKRFTELGLDGAFAALMEQVVAEYPEVATG